jgi:hypothetical protein
LAGLPADCCAIPRLVEITMNWQFYLYLLVAMQLLAGMLYLAGAFSDFASAVVIGLLLFVFFAIAAVVRDFILRRL